MNYILTVFRANRTISERSGKVMIKHSSSNINRTFVQNDLALNNIIETLAHFIHHSWNVSL